jgi:hypothetical protein
MVPADLGPPFWAAKATFCAPAAFLAVTAKDDTSI